MAAGLDRTHPNDRLASPKVNSVLRQDPSLLYLPMVPSSSPNRLHTLCSRSFVLVATVFLVSVTCMAVAPRKIHGDSSSSSLRSIDKQTTDKLFHAKMPRVIVQNRSSNTSTGQDSAVERQRWLVEPHNFFAPLTCNANPCSAKTSNWTLEDYNPEAGTVVIPCGHCITFDGFLGNDLDDPTSLANYFTRHYQNTTTMGAGQSRNITLVLPHGLDIQGWLDIPVGSSAAVHDSNKSSNSYLTIVTPFIRVQGKLSLHVQGSTVGGMPNVRIILTDDDDAATTSFVPEENNAFACSNSTLESEPSRCQVGPKSIVVAGGQLDIRGMADHCSTWVRLYNVIGRTNGTGQSDLIVRDTNGIMGCWGRGSEILITSHSTDFESAQTRRLLTDPERYGEGLIRLRLDADIVPTVTELHNDGFAVEVALLSRNILFEGARDASDSLLGAHLMVMNTPVVKQLIQGVEFRNFGRQGELGRYPIHFHLCGNIDGSLVDKNSIRYSNQRCVVAHGTHNLTVSETVAHETKGHCFMLEDGGELDNTFVRNLGASTRAATRLVRAFETDGSNPSTFWCSNPVNTYKANVAAGSQSSGFWFELQREVRPPTSFMRTSQGLVPRRLPLKLFVDNVAHSNGSHGLRTYPFGFNPPVQAVFDNTRSYKNKRAGVFFHESSDIKLIGGVLADNSIQADFDRADNIEIVGTQVIGSTARFNEIVTSQSRSFAHSDRIVGVQLHGFAFERKRQGANLVDIQFSGFSDAMSTRVALIDIDDDKLSGHFDYWTTLQNISMDETPDTAVFDFRQAAEVGIVDVVLQDVNSSLKPSGSSAVGVSSVISSSSQMTAFVDIATSCHDFALLGYYYCRSICFRSVTFATSPSGTERFVLRVTDNSNPERTFDFPGTYNLELEVTDGQSPEIRNTWILKHRYFAPSVPDGSYTAQFIDGSSGQVVWPTFVESRIEHHTCSSPLISNPVKIEMPSPTELQCRQLVRNGDMESSNSNYPFWLHAETGIALVDGAGIGGTNAISDTVHTINHAYIGQFIDTRCLEIGRRYNARAWVKLVNPSTNVLIICDKEDSTCPSVVLRYRTPGEPTGQSFVEGAHTVAFKIVDQNDGWSLFEATVTIDSSIAGAESVALVVRRGMANVKMYLDNVSMSLLT